MWAGQKAEEGELEMACVRRSALLVLVLLLSGCVSKGQFLMQQERLRALEFKVQELQGTLSKSQEEDETARGSIRMDQADVKADLIDLRTEIQQLGGELSSTAHRKDSDAKERQALEQSLAFQMNHILEQMQAIEARMVQIEDFFGLKAKTAPGTGKTWKAPATPASVPQPVASPPAPAPADVQGETPAPTGTVPQVVLSPPEPAPPPEPLSAEESYNMAYHLFQSRKFEASRTAFEQFLDRHPESHLVDNARFWIGETYYQTADYERAVVVYQKVLGKNPKGSKAPDALLKTGFALAQMGENTAAAAALEKLVREYPQASQVKLAREKLKLLKPKEDQEKARVHEGNQTSEKPSSKKPPAQQKPPKAKNPS